MVGGFGSGRQGGRLVVEDCLTLDINKLVRDGMIVPGRKVGPSVLRWTETRTGRETATMAFVADLADPGAAWMRLAFGSGVGASRCEHECMIRLATTRPRFGGLRWWFACPLSGRRCGKLHLPPGAGAFASRQAWRLDHHSQRLPPWERQMVTAKDRASRVRRRLGGPVAGRALVYADAPPRPKGMWRSTYGRLRRELEEAESRSEAAEWTQIKAIVDPMRKRLAKS